MALPARSRVFISQPPVFGPPIGTDSEGGCKLKMREHGKSCRYDVQKLVIVTEIVQKGTGRSHRGDCMVICTAIN